MSVKTVVNMSNHMNCPRPQKQPAADSEYEADGLESSTHSFSVRVEYYRSFEYSLKWNSSMYPTRSSKLPKASKRSPQRSPSPEEEVIHRRSGGKRQRAGLRTTRTGNSETTNEGKGRDLIDIIDLTPDAERVTEEDEGKSVEVIDEGLDESDEDWVSVTSSIASGPSTLLHASPKRPSRDLCSACKTLYQKAKKMKAPIKDKLLDCNPKSLTCDQWVLIKSWRPRRLPNARRKLLIQIQRVKKRLKVKNDADQAEQSAVESSACSRPHIFLQRNLRQCVRVPAKKGRKSNRKRRRVSSPGPRVAKQQRLHSNKRSQRVSISSTDKSGLLPTSRHGNSPGFEGQSDQEFDDEDDDHLVIESVPTSVTMETTGTREVPPKQEAPKKTGGFRDLLAQLRGNRSVIVSETS